MEEKPMTHAEINKKFDEKVRGGMFNPVARFLTDANSAQDRLQIAIALTWAMYSRYILEKNRELSDGILVRSCKQRAVDLDRDFVPANGTRCRNQDVLDARAYRDNRVELLRLNLYAEADRTLEIAFAEHMAIRPEYKINSAIDLESWFEEQSSTDQAILEKRYLGYTLERIAHDLGVSTSTIHTRCKVLGIELAERAGVKIKKQRRSEK
jgi:hypothetical protein